MHLDYSTVYESTSRVLSYPTADLSDMQRSFLEVGLNAFEGYSLPNTETRIQTISSGGFFRSKSTEALVLTANFKPYKFMGVVTVNPFGALCVISRLKLLEGQSLFGSARSTEEKRTALIRKLSNLVSIDYFAALEAAIDFGADSIERAIDIAYEEYKIRA